MKWICLLSSWGVDFLSQSRLIFSNLGKFVEVIIQNLIKITRKFYKVLNAVKKCLKYHNLDQIWRVFSQLCLWKHCSQPIFSARELPTEFGRSKAKIRQIRFQFSLNFSVKYYMFWSQHYILTRKIIKFFNSKANVDRFSKW